jgi:hypothetical protein
MIAYNKQSLDHLRIVRKAKQWQAQQLLSEEQLSVVSQKYTSDFYTPNLFIKIGLFIFTYILISTGTGLFSILFIKAFEDSNSGFIHFFCLLWATICVVSLEVLIKNRKIYKSGIDQALLYAAIIFICCNIGYLFRNSLDNSNSILSCAIILMPILASAIIRYADTLVAFCLALCCYTIFYLLVLKLGAVAKMILPFAFMLLSVAIYILTQQLKRKEQLIYWRSCVEVFECFALVTFYISCNYFVIRESSIHFFDLSLNEGQDIPLAIVFYLLTAIVPIVYVYYGLKRKRKILLWVGLLLVAAAAMTFKYYFSLGHPEITLTIAGILMIVIAYAAIKYLKTPKHGITFEEELDEDNFLKTNAEAIVLAQSFAQQGGTEQAEHPIEFGGGSSGGGGAGSTY